MSLNVLLQIHCHTIEPTATLFPISLANENPANLRSKLLYLKFSHLTSRMSITNNFGGGGGGLGLFGLAVCVAAVLLHPVRQSSTQEQKRIIPASEEPNRKKESRIAKAGSDSRQ